MRQVPPAAVGVDPVQDRVDALRHVRRPRPTVGLRRRRQQRRELFPLGIHQVNQGKASVPWPQAIRPTPPNPPFHTSYKGEGGRRSDRGVPSLAELLDFAVRAMGHVPLQVLQPILLAENRALSQWRRDSHRDRRGYRRHEPARVVIAAAEHNSLRSASQELMGLVDTWSLGRRR